MHPDLVNYPSQSFPGEFENPITCLPKYIKQVNGHRERLQTYWKYYFKATVTEVYGMYIFVTIIKFYFIFRKKKWPFDNMYGAKYDITSKDVDRIPSKPSRNIESSNEWRWNKHVLRRKCERDQYARSRVNHSIYWREQTLDSGILFFYRLPFMKNSSIIQFTPSKHIGYLFATLQSQTKSAALLVDPRDVL